MQIGVEPDGLDEVIKRFRAAPEKFEQYMRRFMNQALPVIEREVRLKTPVNTGALRSSIGHEITGMGAQMQGIVGTAKGYSPFVELDTRPHWPPYRPIEYWAMRKLGLQGAELRAAVRGIQRKIARAGTTGKRMFAQAFEATRDRVAQLWADTWGDAVKKEL